LFLGGFPERDTKPADKLKSDAMQASLPNAYAMLFSDRCGVLFSGGTKWNKHFNKTFIILEGRSSFIVRGKYYVLIESVDLL
jgi:uncharacterized C2H2 Zn-finger protein